jgi:hypothetical protein
MADLHLDGKPIENAIVDALAVRDPDAAPITDKHGHPEPDPDLRDNENVPLPNEPVRYEPDPTDRLATDTYRKAVEQYVEQEVHPYVPDAWIDHTKTKIGYEIPLTRHFYVYTPPRPLEVIDAEIKQLEQEIQEAAARGDGVTVGNFPFPDISLPEQRAIADYLDAETARIDALMAKKEQLIHLLEERRESAFDKALSHFGVDLPVDLDPGAMRSLSLPEPWRIAKLSSALRQLTNGYVGPTRDILVDEGIRYIQGLHIKKGTIDFGRRPFFVTESWHRARPRTSLRPGDVVIVQTGDIGQCAVVPDDFGEANCHALLIARVNESVACGEYLAAYLQSSFGRHSLLRLATGALHPHLEFGIRDAALLLPPLAEQSEIVAAVRHEQDRLGATRATAIRQLGLLAEHRQALITAAVTGDLQVPGAA